MPVSTEKLKSYSPDMPDNASKSENTAVADPVRRSYASRAINQVLGFFHQDNIPATSDVEAPKSQIPVTRRGFLLGGLAAVGALVLSPRLTPQVEAAPAPSLSLDNLANLETTKKQFIKELELRTKSLGIKVGEKGLVMDEETAQQVQEIMENNTPAEGLQKLFTLAESKALASEAAGDETSTKAADLTINILGTWIAIKGIQEITKFDEVRGETYTYMALLNTALILSGHRREEMLHNIVEAIEGGSTILAMTMITKLFAIRESSTISEAMTSIAEQAREQQFSKKELLQAIIEISQIIGIPFTTILSSGFAAPLCRELARTSDGSIDPKIMSALQGYIPNNSGALGVHLGDIPVGIPFTGLKLFDLKMMGGDLGPRVALSLKIGDENVAKMTPTAIPHHVINTGYFIYEVAAALSEEDRGGQNPLAFTASMFNPAGYFTTPYRILKERGIDTVTLEGLRKKKDELFSLIHNGTSGREIHTEERVRAIFEALDFHKIRHALSLTQAANGHSEQETVMENLDQAFASGDERSIGLSIKDVIKRVKEWEHRAVALPEHVQSSIIEDIRTKLSNICDGDELAHIFGRDVVDIVKVFSFQSLAVRLVGGSSSFMVNDIGDSVMKFLKITNETVKDSLKSVTINFATAGGSATFDNFAALMAAFVPVTVMMKNKLADKTSSFYKDGVLQEKIAKLFAWKEVMKIYLSSIIGGGFTPIGNMPNIVLAGFDQYSMKDALSGVQLKRRIIPAVINYAATEGMHMAATHNDPIAEWIDGIPLDVFLEESKTSHQNKVPAGVH